MFCVLLRKHLQGARLSGIEQLGFERAVMLSFDTRDEMGFDTKCYLVAELMGKYSNLIFLDADKRIVSALKTVDFTTSSLRQVLPGMIYELPPKQDKRDPLECTKDEFLYLYNDALADHRADKFITSNYLGISSAVAREISYRACGDSDATLRNCPCEKLYGAFCEIIDHIKNNEYHPTTVFEGDKAVEYAFCRLTHYKGLEVRDFESPSKMIDAFFEGREYIPPTLEERFSVLLRQVGLMLEYKDPHNAILESRKHAAWYMTGLNGAAALRRLCGEINSLQDIQNICEKALEQNKYL
jgi:predicted ribosome quality control (RQC) complex YloA/Tae2 family protein